MAALRNGASLSRRAFIAHSALALAGTRIAWAVPPGASVLVKTPAGTLQGQTMGGVNVFRGVPFARPPLGPLRFRAPEPAAPWRGTRDATHFASAAMQPNNTSVLQSEDCLYLNVWSPREAGPHPVFVWIHGGGFTGGTSFDPLFDGSSFAQQGIVCITVAYRLGVFGFLDCAPMLGTGYAGGANNALRDVILALSWVQANIAAFGGDPNKVTVGGESAGAKLTDTLMGVPSAAPLFHQMISESGGAERIWPALRAAEIAKSFAAEWTASSGTAFSRIVDAPVQKILSAQEAFTQSSPIHYPLRPELDGTLIAHYPLSTIRQGVARGKRLLLGTNRDESALFIGPHPAKDPGSRDLGNLSVEQFLTVEERYQQIYPGMTDELRRIRSLTAEEYWIPSLRVADAHVEAGGTAFVYRFDFTEQSGRLAGLAYHSSELRFVWDHLATASSSLTDTQFAGTMHTAWCDFIRGEDPGGNGLPVWPAYSLKQRSTMVLDTANRIEAAPQAAEFALWDGFLLK